MFAVTIGMIDVVAACLASGRNSTSGRALFCFRASPANDRQVVPTTGPVAADAMPSARTYCSVALPAVRADDCPA